MTSLYQDLYNTIQKNVTDKAMKLMRQLRSHHGKMSYENENESTRISIGDDKVNGIQRSKNNQKEHVQWSMLQWACYHGNEKVTSLVEQ
jgi:hypothetical protein